MVSFVVNLPSIAEPMFRIISKSFQYISNKLWYASDWLKFRSLQRSGNDDRFPLEFINRMPAIWEKTKQTRFDAHYVYHNAWAMRAVRKIDPIVHIDISSTVYFCSSLSAFIPVRFFDYRPAPLALSQLTTDSCDLQLLHFADGSIDSLSCMHTIEHVGLGRYGDSLDPSGDLKAFSELKRVVAPGGSLLIVVPIGRPRLCFNAHRIYSYDMLLGTFDGFELVNTALITDDGDFLTTPIHEDFGRQEYGCGCFWFRKFNLGE